MNREQFKDKHGSAFKAFLGSETGQAFLNIISASQPPYEPYKEPHLYADNRGCKRGYEMCIRNIIGLTVVFNPIKHAEADYGVPDKPEE